MNISTDFPPNYEDFKTYFPNHEKWKPVFVWGNTIHNPFNADLTPDIIFHEAVHKEQQGDHPDLWYIKYFQDPAFRLEQEVEAYGKQYRFFSKYCRDRELVNHYLQDLAHSLSSELYGSIITFPEARNLIRPYGKTQK